MSGALPIDPLRDDFLTAIEASAVVVSAPTGSGKSTRVPGWAATRGRVLVVEPRRVACRSLARHLAGSADALGRQVGYVVRDERRARPDTPIVFVTPGVALRWLRDGTVDTFDTVILDELHERTLDVDLLLALLHGRPGLVAMSATVEADRVAAHLEGIHLRGEGRAHPVEIVHPPNAPAVPTTDGLEERIAAALRRCPDEGDVLVFLPGRGEIRRTAEHLRARTALEVLELHGGLSLSDQARALSSGRRRRVVLTTNVAETSLTVPGVRAVIDSGLVRRTRYHRGRSVLTLGPIAMDSAEQRAGRAGRTAPGVCVRLWSERASLEPHTPPEIHREALEPLVLAAAACGADELALPWLDPPRDYAIEAARETLRELDAVDGEGRLTDTGAALFGLPLDPALGRLLVEGRARPDALHDAVDLVAGLSPNRPMFRRERPTDPDDDLREKGCDAVALIRAVREGVPDRHGLSGAALREARAVRRRLGSALGVDDSPPSLNRRRLASLILAAWPDAAHVARRRKRRVAWSNGGTELELATGSAVDETKAEVVLVLDTRDLASHRLEQRRLCTAAMPVPVAWLVRADLGRDRLAGVRVRGGAAVAVIERVYAGRVLEERTETPSGDLAREAVTRLFLDGRVFDVEAARDRLDARALWARLHGEPSPPRLEDWVAERVRTLGVASGTDLALLSADDLLPDDLPPRQREQLDREHPRELDIGDARYALRYDPRRRTLVLEQTGGPRKTPPPLRYVPSVPGWRIELVRKGVRRTLRGRR